MIKDDLIKIISEQECYYVIGPNTKKMFHVMKKHKNTNILFKIFVENKKDKAIVLKPSNLYISKLLCMPNDIEAYIGHHGGIEIDVEKHNAEVLKNTAKEDLRKIEAPIDAKVLYFNDKGDISVRSVEYAIRGVK